MNFPALSDVEYWLRRGGGGGSGGGRGHYKRICSLRCLNTVTYVTKESPPPTELDYTL